MGDAHLCQPPCVPTLPGDNSPPSPPTLPPPSLCQCSGQVDSLSRGGSGCDSFENFGTSTVPWCYVKCSATCGHVQKASFGHWCYSRDPCKGTSPKPTPPPTPPPPAYCATNSGSCTSGSCSCQYSGHTKSTHQISSGTCYSCGPPPTPPHPTPPPPTPPPPGTCSSKGAAFRPSQGKYGCLCPRGFECWPSNDLYRRNRSPCQLSTDRSFYYWMVGTCPDCQCKRYLPVALLHVTIRKPQDPMYVLCVSLSSAHCS